MQKAAFLIVNQEDVVPGERPVVKRCDEGEKEDERGAGKAPEENMRALADPQRTGFLLGFRDPVTLCI